MAKRVLDVGQCDPDHGTIRNYLSSHFDVIVDRAKLPADALDKLRTGTYDLVLINRKLDEDYSDGLEILKAIKADPAISAVPVMLVTNYQDQQDLAVANGALRGFGKLEYEKPETRDRLAAVLGG